MVMRILSLNISQYFCYKKYIKIRVNKVLCEYHLETNFNTPSEIKIAFKHFFMIKTKN